MPELGSEITFADGKFVVDDVYVAPIRKITDGHPERFPFKDVMSRMGDYWAKEGIKRHTDALLRDHLSQFGIE